MVMKASNVYPIFCVKYCIQIDFPFYKLCVLGSNWRWEQFNFMAEKLKAIWYFTYYTYSIIHALRITRIMVLHIHLDIGWAWFGQQKNKPVSSFVLGTGLHVLQVYFCGAESPWSIQEPPGHAEVCTARCTLPFHRQCPCKYQGIHPRPGVPSATLCRP